MTKVLAPIRGFFNAFMNTFYGIKVGQGQDYDSAGRRIPVTFVSVNPMWVIAENKVAFGFRKHTNKPLQGMLKNFPFDSAQGKQEKITPKYIRQIKDLEKSVGEKVQIADVFSAGDKIDVMGISKGKGFAGVVKRHGFKGGPMTHGQSTKQRHGGSIGQTTTPGRVYKGKRMAGHMGVDQVTMTNLEVFKVVPEENQLLVKGLVPGAKRGLLRITKA